jgi:CheY-like chemotaxis protein
MNENSSPIPRALVRDDDIAGRADKALERAALPATPSTILIVDDDPLTRAALVRMFQDDGHVPTATSTSFDCLELLDTGASFDIIVIDLVMPPGTPHGFALGRMIRTRDPFQKVLYISGNLDTLPSSELSDANAPMLAKPVRASELQEAVRSILSGKAIGPSTEA